MNIENLYQNFPEEEEHKEIEQLAERILALKTPLEFDDSFATDEQIDALEEMLDSAEMIMPRVEDLRIIVLNTKPEKAELPFI